jgi:hypothetical protein
MTVDMVSAAWITIPTSDIPEPAADAVAVGDKHSIRVPEIPQQPVVEARPSWPIAIPVSPWTLLQSVRGHPALHDSPRGDDTQRHWALETTPRLLLPPLLQGPSAAAAQHVVSEQLVLRVVLPLDL